MFIVSQSFRVVTCICSSCTVLLIGRAGASPPSRATGLNFLFLTHSVYTYRIVLNVSTRFYFSVYATISLAPRASCCLCRGQLPSIMPSNAIYLGHRQLRQYQLYNPPFLVLERNQLLLRFVSTCDNHAVFFYSEPCIHNFLRYLSV